MSTRPRSRRRHRSRRRFPRWQVADGRLVGPILAARVLDLGPAGAHIETTSALRVGAPYAFTLELSGVSRRLRGRVRWCRLVATRPAEDGDRLPVYRAGVVWSPRQLPAGLLRTRPASDEDSLADSPPRRRRCPPGRPAGRAS